MNNNFCLDYISLGIRIRQARKDHNMTQAELGEACSLSTSYIGHVERGSRTLSVDTLFKIASVLEVSMDYLASDSVSDSHKLFTSIEAELIHQNEKKITAFMKVVKILFDNIDKL